MGSHSVACHPTEVRFPPLLPAEQGTRFSDPGGMQGWVDLCYVKATGRELNPRPVNRKSNALPLSHHATRGIDWCLKSLRNVRRYTKSNVSLCDATRQRVRWATKIDSIYYQRFFDRLLNFVLRGQLLPSSPPALNQSISMCIGPV